MLHILQDDWHCFSFSCCRYSVSIFRFTKKFAKEGSIFGCASERMCLASEAASGEKISVQDRIEGMAVPKRSSKKRSSSFFFVDLLFFVFLCFPFNLSIPTKRSVIERRVVTLYVPGAFFGALVADAFCLGCLAGWWNGLLQ